MSVLLVYGNVSSIDEVLDYAGGYNFSLNGISVLLVDEEELKEYYEGNYGYEGAYEFEPDSIDTLSDEDDIKVLKDAYNSITIGDVYIVFTEDDGYKSNSDYDEDDEYYEDIYDYDNYRGEWD